MSRKKQCTGCRGPLPTLTRDNKDICCFSWQASLPNVLGTWCGCGDSIAIAHGEIEGPTRHGVAVEVLVGIISEIAALETKQKGVETI